MRIVRVAPLVVVPLVGLAAMGPWGSGGDRVAITGTVTFTGVVPATRSIDMSSDEYCESAQTGPPTATPVVVDRQGRLADVLVYVKAGVSGDHPTPEAEVVLAPRGCRYTPKVVALRTGQTLLILNDDDTFHNVHAFAEANRSFNSGQPIRGMQSRRTFRELEIGIEVKCDVHGWMQSYIHVLDNPFYGVSAEDGAFDLSALPPGDYVVEAWHPTLGTVMQPVTVVAGQPVSLQMTFE